LIKRKPGFSGKIFWSLEIPFKTGFTVYIFIYFFKVYIYIHIYVCIVCVYIYVATFQILYGTSKSSGKRKV